MTGYIFGWHMIIEIPGMISGLKVVVDENLPRYKLVQFRFPKTKKARIRKKWSKRTENCIHVPCKRWYVNGNTLVVHPVEFEQIKSRFAPV
jgi:hypothetical protein